jgi:hypothetical protein
MKHFNLYVRAGVPEISEPFETTGEAIVDARSFQFSCDPSSDYVFHLWLDHNGNPAVAEYTTDDIEGDEDDDIDNPHSMDDALHGLD